MTSRRTPALLAVLGLAGACNCEEWLATRRQGPLPPEPVAASAPAPPRPASPPPMAPPSAPVRTDVVPSAPALMPPPVAITPAAAHPLTIAPPNLPVLPPPAPPPPPQPQPSGAQTQNEPGDEPMEEPSHPGPVPLRGGILKALPHLRGSPEAVRNSIGRLHGVRPAIVPASGNEQR